MGGQVAVELLLVPQCPHADDARALLAQCLDELQIDVEVAERVGDYPSPTILIDGRDVMTGVEVAAGVSACRLDLPTESQVRRALHRAIKPPAAVPQAAADVHPALPRVAVGVTRDRLAAVTPAARAVHKAILRGFAACGVAPDRVTLAAAVPAGDDVGGVLAELHGHDVIRLDENGGIQAAYPFSGVPTAHTVRIDGGPTVWAMCAIDALGMAAMLGRDTTITSADPTCGVEIRVEICGRRAVWAPETAVVVVGLNAAPTAGECCPQQGAAAEAVAPAADGCCTVMNFFTGAASAQQWLDAHRDATGVILDQGQALRLGVDIFGRLLDE